MERTILHVDMNNCFASIELIDHPEWRGKPLAVCGSQEDRHGIVLAKSNEAKKLGIRTGEAIWEARQKCPELLIVPPHYEKYLHYSRKAREIYAEYTPQVEPFGLDECWMDVSGCEKLSGTGEELANIIRERMKSELKLTVSVGVSFNKIFAKLGSDLKKPDAVTVISKQNFKEVVWPLPVQELMGIGRATRNKLNRRGIFSLGQLAAARQDHLRTWFGINGIKLWYAVNGMEQSPVMYSGDEVPILSIGNGITCRADLVSEQEVARVLLDLSVQVSSRLRKHMLMASGVELSVRTDELEWSQYQMPLPFPTQAAKTLSCYAHKLFHERYTKSRNVRSLTVRAIRLMEESSYKQLSFLKDSLQHERTERVDRAMYRLRERFGKECVLFACQKMDLKIPGQRSDVITLPNANANKDMDTSGYAI